VATEGALQARSAVAVVTVLLAFALACGGGGGGSDVSKEPPRFDENPQFRAIGGISMGAYGALNVGTKHPEGFGTIAALGGPVDLQQLLLDTAASALEVKPQTEIPRNVGEDFTFDHLPPYPGRDVNLSLLKDLFISFGNPFLHHPDPTRLYLAADSEPAAIGMDDAFGPFTRTADVRGFLDGGDSNDDGPVAGEAPPPSPTCCSWPAKGDGLARRRGRAGRRLRSRRSERRRYLRRSATASSRTSPSRSPTRMAMASETKARPDPRRRRRHRRL
jgi:hypothetical protein